MVFVAGVQRRLYSGGLRTWGSRQMPEIQGKFEDVLRGEIAFINDRRALVAAGKAVDNPAYDRPTSGWARVDVKDGKEMDERGQKVFHLRSKQDIVGLACSGGGVRSAAFCLGVLQGLDAINPDNNKPQLLDAVDYLSTVSGGGYIGVSLALALTQKKGVFPFETKLDQYETRETMHIRDYSNYLMPKGSIDIFIGLAAITRGLFVNAMIFLAIILFAASLTVWVLPDEHTLHHPYAWLPFGPFQDDFSGTIYFLIVFACSQIIYVFVRKDGLLKPLKCCEFWAWLFGWFVVLLVFVFFIDLQPYVLAGVFDAAHLNYQDETFQENWIGFALHRLGTTTSWASIAGAATALVAFGNKLNAVAAATRGDRSWPGFLKNWASRLSLYTAALIVPLLLWSTYLAFCYWGITYEPEKPFCVAPQAPVWLNWISLHSGLGPAGIYAIAAAVLLVVSLKITPNANSLHSYYRDRLSRAFLSTSDELKEEIEEAKRSKQTCVPIKDKVLLLFVTFIRLNKNSLRSYYSDLLSHLFPFKKRPVDADHAMLSSLRLSKHAPYLLINTAVNLNSPYVNQRGRKADSFVFSPLFVGSEATGYAQTEILEKESPHLDLGTAMAISGAAASANMGASTIPPLRFSLAALNIRLGYWFPNPRALNCRSCLARICAKIGPLYFAKEAFGFLAKNDLNVYLTDGGHFDNLGLYELLKRRCKVIIAADAEADPPMNCDSLIRLQRYARIDHGVLIDLPWEDIRRDCEKITNKEPHGPSHDREKCHGPHIAIGRIDYSNIGDKVYGVFIYIKSSVSGDESDLIRDYRRRNPDFPHETTIDQFFGEEQFEVYRALGYHVTKNFFTGRDRAAMLKTSPVNDWPETVQKALLRLNIDPVFVERIVTRQRDAMARRGAEEAIQRS
jgi:hypothetical protein